VRLSISSCGLSGRDWTLGDEWQEPAGLLRIWRCAGLRAVRPGRFSPICTNVEQNKLFRIDRNGAWERNLFATSFRIFCDCYVMNEAATTGTHDVDLLPRA
jgi:hypothetical protein